MIKVFDFEQGSPEWFAARAGIPTASEFATVLMTGRGGGDSKERRKYLLTLAGERLTGEQIQSFSNAHTERGKVMETEARDLYCFRTDAEVTRVGFIYSEELRAGASPDGLIGTDGMLEVKTKLPHLQLAALIDGILPTEHKAQCQGELMIAARQWIDFVSYWPKLRPLIIRVQRDEPYIAALKMAVADFNGELDKIVERFK
jgi:YqaJ-like viral recombinase domain